MNTLAKNRRKKPVSRKAVVPPTKRIRRTIRADLPVLTVKSALYGLDDAIGAVSIGAPSDKTSRRRVLRSRIHADNHR
jgi:hypothetical protein